MSNVTKMMVQIKEHDKVLAAAVNVSAIFFPYLGPIVGAILCSRSPYVKYHAYRNLIEQIVSTLIIGFLLLCSFTYSVYQIYETQKEGFDLGKIGWITILIKATGIWLLLGLWGIINTVLSVRDALQALRGDLPARPKWTEGKAMKWAGL